MIIKLLSYNIRFGGRQREDRLAAVIRAVNPDLVVFQEAIDPRVIARLAKATALPHWAAQRDHSIGYISRLEIAHHEWHYPTGSKHSFLEIVPVDSETRIFGLHLSAIFSKWSELRRTREMRTLLTGIEKYQTGMHVLVGDFNTLAPGEILDVRRMPGWIRTLIWLSGRDIQRATIQLMLDAGYQDGFRALYPAKKGYTFPTWDPHLRLDYVFLPSTFADRLHQCEVMTQPEGVGQASDHFPLLAHIDIH
ncbi:MAG: endonuclease/exonuclease/phosphatase family protein [Caldilineaceae bacterium]